MTSWKLGLPVGLFDVSTGLVMVWVTESVGLGIAQQIIVGLAVIIGHNWPVFLRFSGGRGLGITMGVVLILPLINDMTLWPSATFFAILIIGTLVLRSSPLPALTAAASLSPASWMFHETIPVTMGFLAIFLAIVISRLAAAHSADSASVSKKRLLVNRLFFDRDIEDRMDWMYRNPAKKDERGKAD
jgi:glycerol-3-phosphate acyltransferase PlsY